MLALRLRLLAVGSPPVNTVLPVVSGSLAVGQTLSCTTGTWTGSSPISYSYQWCQALLADDRSILTDDNDRPLGVEIYGATLSTYVLQDADRSEYIFCIVTATNFRSVSADSDPVGSVKPLVLRARTGLFSLIGQYATLVKG